MVCFIEYNFTPTKENVHCYAKLLLKYYLNIPLDTIDGQAAEGKKITQETINDICKLFDTNNDDKKVILLTERVWSEYTCIQALPKVPETLPLLDLSNITTTSVVSTIPTVSTMPTASTTSNVDDSDSDDASLQEILTGQDLLKKIIEQCNEIVERRKKLGGCEVLVSSKFPKNCTWKDVSIALPYVLNEHKGVITKFFVNTHSGDANGSYGYMVIKDSHTLMISAGGISDGNLPVFDIDDGFNHFGVPVFEDEFNAWKKKLVDSHGATWDEAILPPHVF